MKKAQSKNVMILEVRAEPGRAQLTVDLDFLTAQERRSIFALVRQTERGASVGFGVQPGDEDDQTVNITFNVPNPAAPSVEKAVRQELVN